MSKIKDWLQPDKSLHIMLSIILVFAFFGITKSLALSVLTTAGIGLLKEFVFDGLLKKGVKNIQDIWADLIGTVIGLASLVYLLVMRSI